jgi:hypothetical protein
MLLGNVRASAHDQNTDGQLDALRAAGGRPPAGANAVMRNRRMIGRTYLERGHPVTILIGWTEPSSTNPLPPSPDWFTWHRPPRATGPRNVLIRRDDGRLVVRPFRGLRRRR